MGCDLTGREDIIMPGSAVAAVCCRCCCRNCAGSHTGGWAHGRDRLGGLQRVPEAPAEALLQVSMAGLCSSFRANGLMALNISVTACHMAVPRCQT
jgi:hypothetical protein